MSTSALILGLLLGVVILATLARKTRIPYPIWLVLGGLALGFFPGLPTISLQPDLVLLLFLPPLVYADAWFTSWRDFRANLRPISLLAIGLVVFTTVLVAVAAHALVPGFSWAAAFVLGAIVSPTDTIAVTVIAQRLPLPRRILTVVEGESLVNDATGLVVYRFAVAAAVTGSFSLLEASGQFFLVSIGGVLFGLVVGWLGVWLERQIDDIPVQITLSLLIPFAAYLPANALNISGILAAVTAGIYAGYRGPMTISAEVRLQSASVWNFLIFVLNGVLFILVGLQLRRILTALSAIAWGDLVRWGVLISMAVILVRILWIFPVTYLSRWLSPRLSARDPSPPWQYPAALSWMGIRGVLSLAAALALPLAIASQQRDLIIFLTLCVILATLLLQGLTLPALIRWLHLSADDDGVLKEEEAQARVVAARAALTRLDELETANAAPAMVFTHLRAQYTHRIHRADTSAEAEEASHDREVADQVVQVQQALLDAERAAVIKLRNDGEVGDDVLRQIEHELDLDQLRLAP